MLESPRL
ncbi:hypothetical protein VCHC56A2_2322, partial [Vibrio cholerae HC-56A2]